MDENTNEGEDGDNAQINRRQDSSSDTQQDGEEQNDSSSQDAPEQQQDRMIGNIVQEEIQYETNSAEREVTRRQYRRRMTLDPLVDLLGDGLFDDEGDNDVAAGEANGNNEAQEENEEDGMHLNLEVAPANNNNNEVPAANIDEQRSENYSELRLLGELLGRYGGNHSGGDDSESSDREDENDENGSNNMDDSNREPLQPARNHSYLPTAQPLYPEEWIPAGQHRQRLSRSNDELEEEMPDEDTNEGSEDTRKKKESEHDEQVHPSLHSPSTEMEYDLPDEELGKTTMAVLEIEDIVLFPGSIIPLRLRDRNWVNYLGALIDDARGLYGHHEGSAGGMGEVRIVILPRVSGGRRRTRRRPRETGGMSTDVGSTEVAPRAPTGRWRVDLIRRGVTGVSRRLTRRRRISSDHSGMSGNVDESNGEDAAATENQNEGETQQQQQQPSEQFPIDGEDSEEELFRPSGPPAAPDDPLTGRIGTMATITFTHEQTSSYVNVGESAEATSSSRVWRNRGGELVVTLLGTTRVRLIRAAKDEKTDPDDRNRIPFYAVEEITDGSAVLPPSWMMQPASIARYPTSTESTEANGEEEGNSPSEPQTSNKVRRDNRAIHNLSIRSSIPEFAYRAVWSRRLSEIICNMIQDSDQFQGLRKILNLAAGLHLVEENEEEDDDAQESDDGEMPTPERIHVHVEDASAFANWMASNMPLSVNDRLDLLEMTFTVQQLRYIVHKLEKKMQETVLRCKHCGAPISQMCHVFSVGGSEGTTGAYVNEHGIVHQTVTLRKVDNHAVVCIGGPETKDSWFPGYSWTIAYCSICSDHLGWKFRKVSKSDDDDPENRPKSFWGFSSITTDEHVSPRRVSFHTRTALTALLRHG